jgi:hypothetical protein
MTPNRIVDSSKKRGFVTGVSGVGLVLALLVIGYGIARPPELSSPSTRETAVAAASAPISSAASGFAGILGPSAAVVFRGTSSDRSNDGIDAARECAPDAGLREACIFN